MHPLITKLLQKKKFDSLEEVSDEPMPDGTPNEKETIENWQRILSSNEEVTVENIKEFCQNQLKEIEGQMKSLDNTARKNDRLLILFSVYKAIGGALEAPQQEREALEQYLTGLLSE